MTDDAPLSEPPPSSGEPMSARAPKKPPSLRMQAVLPPGATELETLGADLAAAGRWDEAAAAYKKAILMSQRGSPQAAQLYVALGDTKLRAGSAREALSNYEKALGADPAHREALERAAQLLRDEKDFAGLERLLRRRAEVVGTREERVRVLRSIVALWLDGADEPSKAIDALEDLAREVPEDLAVLERLAMVHEQVGRHARAVAAWRKLADTTSDASTRAAALSRAARLVKEHLPQKSEAVELAEAALESDVGALESLELAAQALGKARKFDELARLYESVLDRTKDSRVAHQLSKSLGLLYREELDDAEGAARAFARAFEENPADVEVAYALAELCEVRGDRPGAVRVLQKAIAHAPRDVALHRRTLWHFEKLNRADAAWRACAALDFLGDADINESVVADAHRPDGSLAVTGGLTEEDWLEGLFRPDRDDDVNAIFSTLAPAAIRLRLRELEAEGLLPSLEAGKREDPRTSTTTLARSLAWTSKLLGIDVPELYLWKDELPGDLVAVPAERPTVIANRALGNGLSLAELSFLWGRHLALHRSEHRLLVFFPTLRDIAVLFVAALAIAGEGDDAPTSMDGDVATLVRGLSNELGSDERALLNHAVSRFAPDRARRRVRDWATSIQFACNRAGLAACGDLALAAALLERFPSQTDTPLAAQIDDLLAYFVSDAYETIRERTGLRLGGVKGCR